MATVHDFEGLRIWREADEFNRLLWARRASIERGDPALWSQLNRSAGSIADNIAEGFGRGSRGEFRSFLGYARGSSHEARSQVLRAGDRDLVPQATVSDWTGRLKSIDTGILNFIGYLNRSGFAGIRHKGVVKEPEVTYGTTPTDVPDLPFDE